MQRKTSINSYTYVQDDMIDHRGYKYKVNLSSCEIKAWKIEWNRAHDLCDISAAL